MRKFRLTVLLSLSLLAVQVFAEPESLGDPSRVWKDKVIHACWLADWRVAKDEIAWGDKNTRSRPVSEIRRRTVRDVILANYSSGVTGVQVVGFGDCPTDSRLDGYQLLLVNDMALTGALEHVIGISSIGDDRIPQVVIPAKKHSAVGFNFLDGRIWLAKPSEYFRESLGNVFPESFLEREDIRRLLSENAKSALEDQLKYTITHELGHLFGLRHEQGRIDAPTFAQDFSFCQSYSEHRNEMQMTLKGGKLSHSGTEYDPFSIMNYCRSDMINWFYRARLVCELKTSFEKKANLSAENRAGLREVLDRCEFIRANNFPYGLSSEDRAGLRALYGRSAETISPENEFKRWKIKASWIEIFGALSRQDWILDRKVEK